MKIFIAILSVLVFVTACDTKRKKAVTAGIHYTCPMHPQVVKDEPGECPICHMDLVAVQSGKMDTAVNAMTMDSAGKDDMSSMKMTLPNEIELTDDQIRLANIAADTIGIAGFENSMVLTGTIAFNEKNIETISSRVRGRIERLYHKTVGDFIPRGAKVYELYSEELNSVKQEYILLLQKRGIAGNAVINYNQLLQAARHKLRLWGMTPGQINALERTQKSSYVTTFYSPAGGYITQLNVTEGDYVMEGQSMVRIANTSSVWVETQAYSSLLAQINRNGKVTIRIPELGNMTVQGNIEFASPEINPQTRINLLRVSIPNPSGKLKPGMAAYIHLTDSKNSGIAVPIDAVIRNGKMAHVWIKSGENKFKMQSVVIGSETGSVLEIKKGLKAGDVVVTSGTYLLNSEFELRNGGDPMAGMDM